MTNFIIVFTLSAVLGNMPYRIENLLKRFSYILKSSLEFFKKITEKKEKKVENVEKDEGITMFLLKNKYINIIFGYK